MLPHQFVCCISDIDHITSTYFPNVPGCMNCACQYLAASLLYHYDFLKKFATPSHPINFISCLTSLKFEKLKAAAMVKYAYEDEASVHVSLFKGIEDET